MELDYRLDGACYWKRPLLNLPLTPSLCTEVVLDWANRLIYAFKIQTPWLSLNAVEAMSFRFLHRLGEPIFLGVAISFKSACGSYEISWHCLSCMNNTDWFLFASIQIELSECTWVETTMSSCTVLWTLTVSPTLFRYKSWVFKKCREYLPEHVRTCKAPCIITCPMTHYRMTDH